MRNPVDHPNNLTSRSRRRRRARRAQRDQGHARHHCRGAETPGHRPRRHRRRQRERRSRQRARHRRHERAGRQQHQRGRAGDGAAAVAGPEAARRRRVDEAGQVGQEDVSSAKKCAARCSGLAGLGRIGQEVARRAQAFEMTVIAHDPFIAAQVADELGIELVSLDDLCARADYLSLHMPATPQTRHMFNAERLAQVQEGPEAHQHRARRADRRSRRWSRPSRADTSAARRSTCLRPSRRPITRCSSCRRWWPARTLPPRPRKARSWSASKRRRRCATS